jgi:hypothetical protein
MADKKTSEMDRVIFVNRSLAEDLILNDSGIANINEQKKIHAVKRYNPFESDDRSYRLNSSPNADSKSFKTGWKIQTIRS